MDAALLRLLLLQDHNTRVVLLGAALLGLAAGVAGVHLVQRRRALLGDTMAHAMLPGVVVAHLIASSLGRGRWLPGLLLGGAVSGLLGVLAVLCLSRGARPGQDAALAVVLAAGFGLGVALLPLLSPLGAGDAAGLEHLIMGSVAGMLRAEAWLLAGVAAAVLALCYLLRRGFAMLAFDPGFARVQGFAVGRLDLLQTLLITAVIVVGLQTVGLVLMVALLVIPAVAARCWSERFGSIQVIAGALGALSCLLGAAASALAPKLPAGALIVLVAVALALASLLAGRSRGLLVGLLRRRLVADRHRRHRLLCALWQSQYERRASGRDDAALVPRRDLAASLGWPVRRLARALRLLAREGQVTLIDARVRLTPEGERAAAAALRDERLVRGWLLIEADVAAQALDQDLGAVAALLDEASRARVAAQWEADTGTRLDGSPLQGAAP